ncbi:MAG TPA: hypothetical protein VGS97_02960 [Actinocrinis sp.]|uniref:hypothetical protein n=1 Tax=Actinocrinis sp. TaxID=1920516 RepID=UPI002DDD287C|nr:hypothetical protein [Actinocrinis sp.]HEV2343032.1 hypothetical protein [Actinocrinis sp.]
MTAPQHPVHWTLWYELRFYVLFGVVLACRARGLRLGAVALADRGRSLERPFYLLHEKLGSELINRFRSSWNGYVSSRWR